MTPEPDTAPLRILAIAGSLRRASWNRQLLHAAAAIAPASLRIEVFDDLASIPMFDEDLEADTHGGPEPVLRLRENVTQADGVLFATPEYNQSIPGVLKNTIDWLSRAKPTVALAGKPVAVIGATPGHWGTRLSQHALRQTLTAIGTQTLAAPMLFVPDVHKVFDADGALADTRTRASLESVLGAFEAWIRRVSG